MIQACYRAPESAVYRREIVAQTEGWPSGLRRTPGKRVGVNAPPGFESPSLRHIHANATNRLRNGWLIFLSAVCTRFNFLLHKDFGLMDFSELRNRIGFDEYYEASSRYETSYRK